MIASPEELTHHGGRWACNLPFPFLLFSLLDLQFSSVLHELYLYNDLINTVERLYNNREHKKQVSYQKKTQLKFSNFTWQIHSEGALLVADPLCCLLRFVMLHCTCVTTPVKNPLYGSVILLIRVSLILLHWLASFVNFTLHGGKPVWHTSFLRAILSTLRREAMPRASSSAGCLRCSPFYLQGANVSRREFKVELQYFST